MAENSLQATEKLIWKTVAPFILTLGTFGNIMTVWVFSRMKEQHASLPFYLSVLAISDLIVLYTDGLRRYIMFQFGVDFSALDDTVCKIDRWLSLSSGLFSSWLLAAMAMQRSASVIWPHRVNSVCTKRRVRIFVVLLACFSLLLQSHILYGFQVVTLSMGNITTFTWCSVTYTDLSYNTFYLKYWYVIEFLFACTLIPFLVLIGSNVVLIKTVTVSIQGNFSTSTGGLTSQQINSREKRATSMTVTLIVTSLSFILFTSPFAIYSLTYQFFFMDAHLSTEKYAVLNFVLSVTILVYHVNYSVDFYLYCLSGKTFRKEFRRLVCNLRNTSATKNKVSRQ